MTRGEWRQVDTSSLKAFVTHCEFLADQCDEKGYFVLASLFLDAAAPALAQLAMRKALAHG